MVRDQEGAVSAPARWPALLLALTVGVGVGVAGVRLLDRSNDQIAAGDVAVELSTVEVDKADLVEEVEWAGVFGYSSQIAVTGASGVVTAGVEPGTLLERGDTIVEIDASPMVVFYGETPLYRTIAEGVEGPDVLELETNLVELGYDPDGTVTVDASFTTNTELMVERWQEDVGIAITGEVDPHDAVVLGGPVVSLDTPVLGTAAGGTLLDVAPRSELMVTVAVAVGDVDEWTVGDDVVVVLPDEQERAATVSTIGTEITTSQDGSTLDVTVALDGDSGELLQGSVVVRTSGTEVLDATIVPTRALVALVEGGFAVEIADDDGSTRLVGVELGAFDDGWVELTTGGVAPGELVVVPQ